MGINKKILILIILTTLVLLSLVLFLIKSKAQLPAEEKQQGENQQEELIDKSKLVLFLGCEKCSLIEKYIQQNPIESKLSFEKKYIYGDEKNTQEMLFIAKECGILGNDAGVPLFWNGSECFIGDKNIESFFEIELGKS
jgi:hypothetical protein